MEINRNPKEGDKVIVRSNEDEPLMIGTLVRFEDIHNRYFPIVESDGLEWWVGGIVIKHSDELEKWLRSMPTYKRQWNAISLHVRLEEP